MARRGGIRGLSVLGMVSAALLAWQPAVADDATSQIKLEPPSGRSYRVPDDKYRIYIPASVPVEVLQNLHLELDGIDQDVGATVSRQGDLAIYTPPQRLAYGRHELRLVEVTPQGEIKELALWSFDVRQSASYREAQVSANANLNAAWLALNRNLPEPSSRLGAQGGLQVQGSVADKDWRVNANADFTYDRTATPHKFNLGSYLVTRDTPDTNISVGHHAVEPVTGSLILEGFNRRGVSGTVRTADQLAQVTGFTMRTEAVTGYPYGLGVTNPEHRTTGITGSVHPLRSDPNRLTLAATYLYGSGTGAGTGIGSGGSYSPSTPIPTGDAASVVADSQVLDHHLRLRGEYAQSRFDLDGSGSALDPVLDHAYSLLAAYTPAEKTVGGEPLRWEMGIQNQQVGTNFASQGNPGLAPDIAAVRLYAHANWKGFDLTGALRTQHDNVDNASDLPRIRINSINLAGNYSPLQTGAEPSGFSLFRQPNYQFAYLRDRSKQVRTPSGWAGDPTDTLSEDISAGVDFVPGLWSWGSAYRLHRDFDYLATGSKPNGVSHNVDLHANVPVGQRLNLSPSANWAVTYDRPTGLKSTDLTANLGAGYQFTETVNGNLNYAFTRHMAGDPSVHTANTQVSGSLTWTYLQPHDNKPGVTFILSGNYAKLNDSSATPTKTNNSQVFLTMSIGWSPSYPRAVGY